MGIDPVTHEPLHKETDQNDQNKQSQSHASHESSPESETDHQQIITLTGADAPVISQEDQSSNSPSDHNSSSDESNLLSDGNLYENDPLISCLFRDDTPPFPWEFPSPPEDLDSFCATSWEDNCSWMLDCQDFGIHDFGFDCFDDLMDNNQ